MTALRSWLWKWRWPGAPMTVVVVATVLLDRLRATNNRTLDVAILVEILLGIALAILAVVIDSSGRGKWSERSTGLVLFLVGDAMLYGAFFLPARLGWVTPYPNLAQAFLRANLIAGPPLLIASYSDWFWVRFCDWRKQRRNGIDRCR